MDAKDQKRQFRLGSVELATEMAEKMLGARYDGNMNREQYLWDTFLGEADRRIAFEAFRLMLSYKYGKPVEKKEITVEDGSFVAEVPSKMDDAEWAKRYSPTVPKSTSNS